MLLNAGADVNAQGGEYGEDDYPRQREGSEMLKMQGHKAEDGF
jgi:hypothetical protein